MATSNTQIEAKLGRYLNFLGVFPNNLLPNRLRVGQCLIANLQNSNQPGSHWVGAYYDPNYGKIYIDSFGAPPTTQMSRFLREYRYLNIDFQEFTSERCGEFQTYIAWNFLNNNFSQCFDELTFHPSEHNEHLVLQFWRRI